MALWSHLLIKNFKVFNHIFEYLFYVGMYLLYEFMFIMCYSIFAGNFDEFNVSWLRGGHPLLNVSDLSAEASQSLGLLLDQLRSPSLKSHSYLVIIVLIKRYTISTTQMDIYLPCLLCLSVSLTSILVYIALVFQLLQERDLLFMAAFCLFYLVWVLQVL